jgi:CRISPR-associated protein Cas5h
MDSVVVFELRGTLGHYRRPDTLGTHASYPFIPHTTLRGLIGAVLGISPAEDSDGLPAGVRCALRLLGPIRTVAQQLSLHGKKWIGAGPNESFHRPTSVELVVEPRYRVYYAGPLADDLAGRLERRQSHYHTYLGSAFCLTFPEFVGVRPAEPIPHDVRRITAVSVVPLPAVGKLDLDGDAQYARIGGMLRTHVGGRRFRGTVGVVYEVGGGPVAFEPAAPTEDSFWEFRQVAGEGVVCLW